MIHWDWIYREPRIALLAALATFALAGQAHAETLFALREGGAIQRIDSAAPGTILGTATVSGLAADEVPAGLDYRPQDGRMYMLTYDTASTAGTGPDVLFLRTVNPLTGAVGARAELGELSFGPQNEPPFRVAEDGSFGDDFDPETGDLYVLVNGTGLTPSQLVKVDIEAATMTTVGNPGGADVYPALAFDHNRFSDPASPTAYDFDFSEVAGARNIGTLDTATGAITTLGASGVDPGVGVVNPAGVELDSSPATNAMYLVAGVGGGTGAGTATLFTVNGTTGHATAVGTLPSPDTRVIGIAARPNFVHSFFSNHVQIDESFGILTQALARADPVGETVVDYTITPANPGLGHYLGADGTIAFAPGEESGEIQIPIPQDGRFGTDENFTISYSAGASGPDGEALLATGTRTEVTVHNNLPAENPIAAIDTPSAGGVYPLGALVHTAFHCTDGFRGPGIASCADSNGEIGGVGQLDTDTPGEFLYEVKALSEDTKSAQTSIEYTVRAPPAEPVISDPPSPGNSKTPLLSGTAPAGTLVDIYADDECAGPVVVTIPAMIFSGTGVFVPVPENATTFISAQARDNLGQESGCSEEVEYTNDTLAPNTRIAVHPGRRTHSHRATFHFKPVPEAGFQCLLDGGAWRQCGPARSFHVGSGSHRILVRAVDEAGNPDPTPARFSWRVG